MSGACDTQLADFKDSIPQSPAFKPSSLIDIHPCLLLQIATMAITQEPKVKSFETRLFINGKVSWNKPAIRTQAKEIASSWKPLMVVNLT
jgi:hypothetical protein